MPLGKEDVDDWNVLMLSSFVLLQFFSNSFVFDQSCIRSTRSWALLFWPLGIVSDTVVSSTYFHMLKMLGTDKSLIMGRKSQGPNMVPWGTPDGTVTLLRQSVFAEFDSLGSFWKDVDNPIDHTVRNLHLFQFRDKDTMIYKIKNFEVVEKKYPHCRTVAICSFEPLVYNTNTCQLSGSTRYVAAYGITRNSWKWVKNSRKHTNMKSTNHQYEEQYSVRVIRLAFSLIYIERSLCLLRI